jgi:hypothetical protein
MSSSISIDKQPDETIVVGIDFTNLLGTDTISSINSTVVAILGSSDSADLTIDSTALNGDSDTVNITLSSGTAGLTYQVTTKVTTSNSEIFEGEAVIVCRDLVWYFTPLMIIRTLINDLGATPDYSDARLNDIFLVAAYQVDTDLNFDYTVDMEAGTISPDPTTDEIFINLATLKAACIIDRGNARLAAAVNGLESRCGPLQMKTNRRMEGFGLLLDKGYCAAYAEAVKQYTFGNGRWIKGILSPFVNENFFPHHHNTHYDHRTHHIKYY